MIGVRRLAVVTVTASLAAISGPLAAAHAASGSNPTPTPAPPVSSSPPAPGSAPTVTEQPQSVRAAIGQTVTFTSEASGNPTPTVQWQVSTNGCETYSDVPGATSETLVVAASVDVAGNCYRAVFTNDPGSGGQPVSVDSNRAELRVVEEPTPVASPPAVSPPKRRHTPQPEESVKPIYCGPTTHHHHFDCVWSAGRTGPGTFHAALVAFTSADSAVFTEGTDASFTVSTTGKATITDPPGWPAGISFTPGTGTATISGTPAFGTAGTYVVPLTASLDGKQSTQQFTLTVLEPGSAKTLPFTGQPVWPELGAALAALLLGCGLVVAGTRRRPAYLAKHRAI